MNIILFLLFLIFCKDFYASSVPPRVISDPAVINEYQRLKLPFTLTASAEEAKESLSALPPLNMRQQVLGYNGWEAAQYPDCDGFHKRAETWNNVEYDEYFRRGFLREAIFLLTGFGEGLRVKKFWNKADGSINDECRARIVLSLYHEAGFLRASLGDSSLLHVAMAEHILRPKILQEIEDSSFYKTVNLLDSAITKERVSPKNYEKHSFTSQIVGVITTRGYHSDTEIIQFFEEDNQLTRFTLCAEHTMLQMIDALGSDPAVLRLGRQFHKQKLIEERLYKTQNARLEGTLTDEHFESVGQAFEREHDLADIVNRALFQLIGAKLKHAYELYIEPLSAADTSFMSDEYVVNEEGLPRVDHGVIHAYMPEFMNNPLLRKILDAEYVGVLV